MSIKKRTYVLLFILGLTAGIFFGLQKAKASSPEGEASTLGGLTYYYDEFWQATQALVSRAGGFGYQNISNTVGDSTSGSAAVLNKTNNTVERFPKMVVTKWKVHGHIHF